MTEMDSRKSAKISPHGWFHKKITLFIIGLYSIIELMISFR